MDSLDAPPKRPPPPPPPKDKMIRPKITIQMPDATTPMTPRGLQTSTPFNFPSSRYRGRAPMTPASLVSEQNPYFNPFMHMYHNKASEFMFKQFEGFKEFSMNTAKSGLSAGEKSAFWFVNKLKILSKKWFTHFFLTICLVVYSIIGAAVFMALEGSNEKLEHSRYNKTLKEVRSEAASKLLVISTEFSSNDGFIDLMSRIEKSLEQYEENYTDYINNVKNKKTWTFWNAMFYAGTIYTTIATELIDEE